MLETKMKRRAQDDAALPNAAERAKSIIPRLSALAEANEQARRLTPETLALLAEARLEYYLVPKCFGGEEVWPLEMMEVIEHMSYADASTGWAVMAWNMGTASAAAFLPAVSARHIFGKHIPLMAGQAGAVGRATPVPGGYRLSGNWTYGSGILHAEWARAGAVVQTDGEPCKDPETGQAVTRMFCVPMEQVTLEGNWDVLGLRATGSVDYSVTDAFIPEEFTHEFGVTVPNHGGDLYRLGTMALVILMHASFVLGVARRVLDETRAFAMSGKRTANFPQIGGGETFQEDYGRFVAAYQAARAGIVHYAERAEQAVREARPLPTRELTQGVLAVIHANQVAIDLARFGYYYQGGNALRSGTMQRLFRDITASGSHYIVSKNLQREAAKEVMGLYEGKTWTLMAYS